MNEDKQLKDNQTNLDLNIANVASEDEEFECCGGNCCGIEDNDSCCGGQCDCEH